MASYWEGRQCAGRDGESSPVWPLTPLIQVASVESALGCAHRAVFITLNEKNRVLFLQGTTAPHPTFLFPSSKSNSHKSPPELPQAFAEGKATTFLG